MKMLGKFLFAGFLTMNFAQAANESELILRDAKGDQKLTKVYRVQDEKLAEQKKALSFLLGMEKEEGNCQELCENACNGEGGQGSGSSACWDRCSAEGYSSSTCAERCGISTAAGSKACWSKCGNEGYSSSTCAQRCGVTTSAGSKQCWTKCGNEGYSSSTCADRCGTTTAGGSAACWDRCTQEGYSSSTCAQRCGTN